MNEVLFYNIWIQLTLWMNMYLQSYLFRWSPLRVKKKWMVIIPYIMYVIWMNICFALGINPVIRLITQVLVFIFFAYFIYDLTIRQIATRAIFFISIMIMTEAVIVMLWDVFDPTLVFIEYGEESSVYHYSVHIANCILGFAIIFVVDKLFYTKEEKFSIRDSIPFLISLMVFLALNIGILSNWEFAEDDSYARVFLICSILMLLAFIHNANAYSKRLRKRQQEQDEKRALFEMKVQKDYYQKKLEDEEQLKSIYHDLKNHLLILEEDNGTEKGQVLREIREKIAGYEEYRDTGNKYLDIIIKEKSSIARKKGSEVAVDIAFGSVDFIDSLDISSIFGTLFDRAIAACEKAGEEQFIELKTKLQNKILVIVMRSSCALSEDELQTEKIVHSLKKYEGYHSIAQSEGEFLFTITIPVGGR